MQPESNAKNIVTIQHKLDFSPLPLAFDVPGVRVFHQAQMQTHTPSSPAHRTQAGEGRKPVHLEVLNSYKISTPRS